MKKHTISIKVLLLFILHFSCPQSAQAQAIFVDVARSLILTIPMALELMAEGSASMVSIMMDGMI